MSLFYEKHSLRLSEIPRPQSVEIDAGTDTRSALARGIPANFMESFGLDFVHNPGDFLTENVMDCQGNGTLCR